MTNFISGIEFIFRGGFMIYPLLIAALISLTVIFERMLVFRTRYQANPILTAEILEDVRTSQLTEAQKKCAKFSNPVCAVLQSGIEHFSNPIMEMELAMKNQAEQWVPILEKRIGILDTIITAAPLMGLLGTITGMMASFKVLSEKGVNQPNAITGGVAEALIATATGLVIALISMFAYNYLSSKVKHFIYEVESAASRLIEARMAVERNGGGK